jgi:hypothetical protein
MPIDVDRRGKVVAAGDARDALALQRLDEHRREVVLVVALAQLAVLVMMQQPAQSQQDTHQVGEHSLTLNALAQPSGGIGVTNRAAAPHEDLSLAGEHGVVGTNAGGLNDHLALEPFDQGRQAPVRIVTVTQSACRQASGRV